MVNYRRLSWDIKCLKTRSYIDLDSDIQLSEKNDLKKNICVNIKLH